MLVTGAAGFIGSQFVRTVLAERPEVQVTVLDALTYAGNLDNLKELEENPRYRFVHGSITEQRIVHPLVEEHEFDWIINFAAESHVDRSLASGAIPAARTNFEGAVVLLEAVKRFKVGRFLQVSTDEVYGSIDGEGLFSEASPIHPNNPYSTAKAAADLMVQTYVHSFGIDAVITRSTNNYGPRQFPEKFIPVCVSRILEGKPCPIYGDGLQVRDWLHVEDNCKGILLALERGKKGEVYNLGGMNERTNLSVAKKILAILGKHETFLEHVGDRLGHDRRYAVSIGKAMLDLGWEPSRDFDLGLRNTVRWYEDNQRWISSSKARN